VKIDLTRFRKITYPGIPENRYLISEDGKVFSIFGDRLLKHQIDKDGYFRITILRKKCSVSRLVAYQFHLNRDLSLVVDHIDGNKQNNHYTNLEWVTVKENTNRAEKMNLRNVRGISNGNNKYREKLIHEICQRFTEGFSNMDVFRIYKGPHANIKDHEGFYALIHKLRKKELWPDVTKNYEYSSDPGVATKIFKVKEDSRFTEEEIHKICKLFVQGLNPVNVLKTIGIDEYGIDYSRYYDAISGIRRGKTWKYISDQYVFDKTSIVQKKFPLTNIELEELIIAGYNPEEILTMCDMNKKNNHKAHRRILKIFKLYNDVKQHHDRESIYLDKSQLDNY